MGLTGWFSWYTIPFVIRFNNGKGVGFCLVYNSGQMAFAMGLDVGHGLGCRVQ